ncbi:uncharacterized protein TRIVIDRAFT_43201 [Trichoderma virens Gv29-8]|uniref:Ecp2 effector protein domain-containing protein n=1 Tax=Hypocrea virens (strain Gv29-8 / FGSC 10586) TaxID=413071 RepID=G9N6V0_HYPVG|nr:uncharacterized protein TRIVIDRAFT_43201 [Trichoderma virens Gv29-8]EHK17810.1 hypothetical protein TRIVIDRAFT_43201 [Trichoderma virens Gv29-8]UKZ53831.1 hypothetical protein TrVGV298_007633 [Trichoderma virens]UKZ79625.1 hypothetical protein TrVFT333_007385 [Trichoderma virens FT-333]
MRLTTAIFTTLCLAFSATADQRICFPIPGQPATVPQSILDLDPQIKVDWGNKLCAQSTFPSEALQISYTALEDGILAEDGHIYGVELALRFITSELICTNLVNALLGVGACPGGGLFTLSGPFEQWSYLVALN